MAGYFLTDSDVQKLRALLAERDIQALTPSLHSVAPSGARFSPEVHVIRTPAGGIPALDIGTLTGTGTGTETGDDIPGSATCSVYRRLRTSTGVGFVKTGRLLTVYNLTGAAVAEGKWAMAIRDKFGDWYLSGMWLDVTECP